MSQDDLAFFRRHLAFTGVNKSGSQACEKLQTSEVLIAAAGNTGECLKSLLEASSIGRVTLLSLEDLQKGNSVPQVGAAGAVSVSTGAEDVEFHSRLDDWCFDHKLTWLRVAIDAHNDRVDLGPLFRPDENPCYRCFYKMHGQSQADSNSNSQSDEIAGAWNRFWLSMIASEIVYYLNWHRASAGRAGFCALQAERLEFHASSCCSIARMPPMPASECADFICRRQNKRH